MTGPPSALPAPQHRARSPRALVTELGELAGAAAAAGWCADLLSGADVHDYVAVLP